MTSSSPSPSDASQHALALLDADRADPDASARSHQERLATLGMLSASVVHEINNILTPALAYAELAMASPDNARLAGKALRKSADGIRAATQMAQAILGFATADERGETSHVASVVESSLACVAFRPERRGVEVILAIEPELHVRLGPQPLQQVLLNLILNAMSAMGDPHARQGSQLRITATDLGGDRVRLIMSDNGCGIDPEVGDRLFDPFVTGTPGGTGLGLSICRRLVVSAGGTIDAASAPNEGTTITIELPSPIREAGSTA